MKILWKNVWYNLVLRNFSRIKYYWGGLHKDSHYPFTNWSAWYYPFPMLWTKEQEDKLYAELDEAVKKLEFRKPLTTQDSIWYDPRILLLFPEDSHRPGHKPDAPRNSHEDDTDHKAT